MAASGGHLSVSRAWKAIKLALDETGKLVRAKLPQAARAVETRAQPVHARNTVQHRPLDRIVAIRQSQSQSQSRWYSTRLASKSSLRQFSSSAQSTAKYDRSTFPSSRTSQAVSRLTGRAPFASTLRPNLTGGTLSRSAGGYGTGAGRIGGARYFSHTPATPAQVISHVSQAARAFWLSGQKVQFHSVNDRNEKQFKAVSALQDEAGRRLGSLPAVTAGSYIDFKVSPTITAIGPLSSLPAAASEREPQLLNDATVMSTLSADFARAFKDLAVITGDLQKLSRLGDLSLSLPNSSTLRVRFPGCDGSTVNRLCEELEVRRGLVYEDEDFDSSHGTEMALLFPLAPGATSSPSNLSPKPRADQVDWRNMLSPCQQHPSPRYSTRSITSHDFEEVEAVEANPWLSSLSGYSSLSESEGDEAACFRREPCGQPPVSAGYEGMEGIYRFLEECDRARR